MGVCGEMVTHVLSCLVACVIDEVAGKFLRVLGALVYTYKTDRGVPYIYRGIAYDSRRGRGIARVQWGGTHPHTKEPHT